MVEGRQDSTGRRNPIRYGGSHGAEGAYGETGATREETVAALRVGSDLCEIAKEIEPLAGVKPVEWRLLSNRVPEGREDIVELIDWYRARWEIEMFFNVLKNGCCVEALQLSTVDRIERALALFMIVA